MKDRIDEFTALYPDKGPNAGTGPRSRDEWGSCVCGHLLRRHAALGACMVIVPSMLMRADGRATREERTYCPCLNGTKGEEA